MDEYEFAHLGFTRHARCILGPRMKVSLLSGEFSLGISPGFMDQDIAALCKLHQTFMVERVSREQHAGSGRQVGKPVGTGIERVEGATYLDVQGADLDSVAGMKQMQPVFRQAPRILVGAEKFTGAFENQRQIYGPIEYDGRSIRPTLLAPAIGKENPGQAQGMVLVAVGEEDMID